ncbi:Palmitoyltransferase swf1 [Cyphellophora attinorum]|uniref:Palmitoyltransferase n=1 Tax=Cyphellophora attinorum TaxID=1664694 RepID=A0A0N1HKZ0_9EURO|nr:Palmitoyltransferase swf1 [Phialophora attinorum]KPI35060.1 Palmitoyltransferase swf1 [Phialophora attinorum]
MLIQHLVDMSVIKTIIITILSISTVVFVALFGRLPAFRRTPIAFLHKLLTRSIPNAFIKVDTVLTGRRLTRGLYSTGHYLMFEKHPLVLIFFVGLQTGGEAAMIPALWPTLAIYHKFLIPILVALPHYYLYLTATTSSAIIVPPAKVSGPPNGATTSPHNNSTALTDHNLPRPALAQTTARFAPNSQATPDFGPSHHRAIHAYPYDYLLYHPGYFCSTCHHPKPPRSKHCSLCKACIQKADHHCIWVNNCVGRNNYLYFLLLLVAITALLIYGTLLGWWFMRAHLDARFVGPLRVGHPEMNYWSSNTTWGEWFDRLAWALMQDVRVGAVALLCAMCTPLGAAFLGYHAYLLWAGMTTNEQGKWGDWREDVADEVVFRAELGSLREGMGDGAGGKDGAERRLPRLGLYPMLPPEVEPRAEDVDWPPRRMVRSRCWSGDGDDGGEKYKAKHWYIRTRDGDQPALHVKAEEAVARGIQGGEVIDGEIEVDDHRWERVRDMRREMDNIYDLGFWGNLLEVVLHRER